MSDEKFSLELTEQAERVYSRLYEAAQKCIEAGDRTNSKVTLFRMVEEALDKIIPHDPFSPQKGLRGPLSGIYRVKKGRLRICCAGSSEQRRLVVLYISESPRKQGDANDPYVRFTKMVKAGIFDGVFEKLRPRKPGGGIR